MAEMSIKTLYEQIRNHVPTDEDAQRILAEALDALEFESKETYAAPEVLAIGTYLMSANFQELQNQAANLPPATQQLVEAMDLGMKPLKQDVGQLLTEKGFPRPKTGPIIPPRK